MKNMIIHECISALVKLDTKIIYRYNLEIIKSDKIISFLEK